MEGGSGFDTLRLGFDILRDFRAEAKPKLGAFYFIAQPFDRYTRSVLSLVQEANDLWLL